MCLTQITPHLKFKMDNYSILVLKIKKNSSFQLIIKIISYYLKNKK